MMEDKVEKQHKMKNTHIPKYTPGKAVSGQGAHKRLNILTAEHRKLDKKIKTERSAIKKIEDDIYLRQQKVCELQEYSKTLDHNYEEALKKIDKKHVKAHTILEKGAKAKQENNAMMEKLNEEKMALISEISQVEEVLNKYKWYGNILFKLSPQEWQDAQETETETETLKASDAQKNQNSKSEKTAVNKGVEGNLESSPDRVLPSATEPTLSSSSKGTLVANSNLASDSACEEENLKLYFSDPSQVVVAMSELRDRILFLKQNSTKEDTALNEAFEITRAKIKEKEEKLTLQVKDMQERVQREKEKSALFKKKVQLHNSLKTNDQDKMLEALTRKVTNVHSCCMDSGLANLKTLDKLSAIEHHLFSVLQEIESIPEEEFTRLCHIEESKKKYRLEMEKLQLEKEKNREKMRKCLRRSLGEAKKITGRKLMPRCMPVKQKTQASEEPSTPEDEDLHSILYSEDFD